MLKEQLEAIVEQAAQDAGFRERLIAAKDVESVVAVAKQAGFLITVDAFECSSMALSEEELETVIGSVKTGVSKCKKPSCLTATSKADSSA